MGEASFTYAKVDRTTISTKEKRSLWPLCVAQLPPKGLFSNENQPIPPSPTTNHRFVGGPVSRSPRDLNSIVNQLGAGSIYEYSNRATAEFAVVGLQKIQHIILPFFLQYPLIGFKLTQYELWKKAVLESICNPKFSKDRELRMIEIMAELSNSSPGHRGPMEIYIIRIEGCKK
jgi:hypothetical protein